MAFQHYVKKVVFEVVCKNDIFVVSFINTSKTGYNVIFVSNTE